VAGGLEDIIFYIIPVSSYIVDSVTGGSERYPCLFTSDSSYIFKSVAAGLENILGAADVNTRVKEGTVQPAHVCMSEAL
jgi:hypothetical protein